MSHPDKFRIATVESYRPQTSHKAEPSNSTDNDLHSSVGHLSSPVYAWIPMGGEQVRDLCVLRASRSGCFANSCDVERGEEEF